MKPDQNVLNLADSDIRLFWCVVSIMIYMIVATLYRIIKSNIGEYPYDRIVEISLASLLFCIFVYAAFLARKLKKLTKIVKQHQEP